MRNLNERMTFNAETKDLIDRMPDGVAKEKAQQFLVAMNLEKMQSLFAQDMTGNQSTPGSSNSQGLLQHKEPEQKRMNVLSIMTKDAETEEQPQATPTATSRPQLTMKSSSGGKRKLDDVSNAEVSTPKSLREMVEQLKSDLGIEASNIKEVIQEAADLLGVEKEEKTLLQLAAECCGTIG